MKSTRFRNILPILVCAVIMITGVSYSQVTKNSWSEAIADQLSEMSSLQNRLGVLEAAAADSQAQALYIASGLDTARQDADDVIMNEFFSVALTWDSFESYNAVRQILIEEYGLSESDLFLSTFMPEAVEVVLENGTMNEIDIYELNSAYKDLNSNVISIAGGTYSYFTIVTISTTSRGGYTLDDEMAFMYSINSDGDILGLMAYELS